MNVSKHFLAKVGVAVLAVVMIVGCQSGGKGPTDQELVQMRVKEFTDALLAKDVERVMDSVSENFYHPEAGDKTSAKELMKQGLESGFVQNGKIDTSKMEVKIEKDTATAYPIQASADAGSVTVGVTMKKEKFMAPKVAAKPEGKAPKFGWYVTALEIEGI